MPGDGRCGVGGDSPRVYFNVPNMNAIFEGEVYVESDTKECYLVARSNHEDRPRGFGGYYLYLNFKEKKMYFKKEIAHENKFDKTQPQGYSSRLNDVAINFTGKEWHKASIEIRNLNNGSISIIGKFDNTQTKLIDNGTIQCGNDNGTYPNTRPFTERGKWCFFRTNDPLEIGTKPGVYYRNAKITNLG
jgi:hypothetical protein